MRIMFVGDMHGDAGAIERLVRIAQAEGITEMIQVGDWGYIWPPNYDWTPQLSMLLTNAGIHMRFIDGNHDYHGSLFRLVRDRPFNVFRNITYQHRGTHHIYPNGCKVSFMGGAASIDYRGRTEGKDWWYSELITDGECNQALWGHGWSHILVTHDTMQRPENFKESTDMTFYYRAENVQAKLRYVADSLHPKLNVHGHYHHRYTGQYKNTRVEGLHCNYAPKPEDSYLIVDTNTLL